MAFSLIGLILKIFILSCLQVLFICCFWFLWSHIFFFGVRLLSTEVNYFMKFSIGSFAFKHFKRELSKISVNQLFWPRFLESSFQHNMDHTMMMITKTSFKGVSICKKFKKYFLLVRIRSLKEPLHLRKLSF